jgi:ABC-2 type transport system ATP-binding protein
VRDLVLRFGPVAALRGVSFQVPSGRLCVLAGPDGAGKSTLLRVVSTLLRPTSGEVLLEGQALRPGAFPDVGLRRRLAYLPQGFTLYEDLSVQENMQFFGELYELDRDFLARRTEELLAWSGLAPFRRRLAGQLSGGMKQKLSLCALILRQPSLLLLDEPTTGVDAPTRAEFWTYLTALKKQGMTVLVATPYLEEARLADKVIFLQEGRVVAEEEPAGLLRLLPGPLWELATADPLAARRALQGRLKLVAWRARRIRLMGSREEVEATLAASGVRGTLSPARPTFEDVFLYLAGSAQGS